jgi:hypothetical protein
MYNVLRRDLHEAGHAAYCLGHDMGIDAVQPGLTVLVTPIPPTPLQTVLGSFLAGEAAEALADARPVNILAKGCYNDIEGAMQLLAHRADRTKQLATAIDHVQRYLSQPAVWRCVEGLARVLSSRGGYLSGNQAAKVCDGLGQPFCRCLLDDNAPRPRPAATRSTMAGDVMHDPSPQHEAWRRQAWKGLNPQQRQAALEALRQDSTPGMVAPLRWLA